mgnify:CR=1 FL=1
MQRNKTLEVGKTYHFLDLRKAPYYASFAIWLLWHRKHALLQHFFLTKCWITRQDWLSVRAIIDIAYMAIQKSHHSIQVACTGNISAALFYLKKEQSNFFLHKESTTLHSVPVDWPIIVSNRLIGQSCVQEFHCFVSYEGSRW